MSQKRNNKRLCSTETEASTFTASNEYKVDATFEEKGHKNEEITLLIAEEQLVCPRSLLVDNSDYFRVMLKGNFIEKDKKSIQLMGVEAKAMRNLLQILSQRSYFSKCEDIYAVLSACGMFLFEELKSWMIFKLDQIITPMNCLEVWVEMEKLDITPICWKAKSISLQYFNEIADNGTITDLSLLEVCAYLGHVNLQCDEELIVFQSAMTWYDERPNDANSQDAVVILKMLISCISFKNASLDEILEMKLCRDIEKYPGILKIFENILNLKSEKLISPNAEDESYSMAVNLVNSKVRYLPKYPCLLIKKSTWESDGSIDSICDVIYYDKYKRKRRQKVIRDDLARFSIICYDGESTSPKKLGELRFDKLENLTGFGMQDYKSKIFIFGGEFCIGKGSWNREVWLFDIESGKMEQKHSMPSPRRHFESCVCGDYFFIVGGTGTFRVIQDNMYWYEFKSDTWSKEVALPCSGRQIKCCSIKKQIFIFSLNDKCGYFFIQDTTSWKKLAIDDPQHLIPKVFTTSCIFYYNGKIFLKGEKLIELELVHDTLKVVKLTPMPQFHLDDIIETVVSHNVVYTMYTHKGEDDDKMSLESLNLDTLEIEFIFKYQSHHCLHPVDKVQTVMKLFLLHHYELVSHNTMVNI